MKSSRLLWVLMLVALVAVMGCEGEQGPAGPAGPAGPGGADGEDGLDGTVACLDCHNTEAQNAIEFQYQRSQHALGDYVDYAGGRSSCARCHSGEGFKEFAETGDVDGNINVPVPIGCTHCHSVHTTFEVTDLALRTSDPVAFLGDAGYGDYVVDFGTNANLCANCHQSRRGEPNVTNPGEATFTITSTHYGPHHGAQANVLEGQGFAEIAGSTSYPSNSLHLVMGADCITCHMGEYADGTGGHTWEPSLLSCQNAVCHGASATDFNVGGVQEDVQAQLDTLRDLLLGEGAIEWVVEDEAYEPVVGPYDMVVARAFFNWVGLSEDRSLGVHNPRYVDALLSNSIEALEARVPAK